MGVREVITKFTKSNLMNPANRGTDDTYGTWLKEESADSAQGYQTELQRSGNSPLVLKEEGVQQATNTGKGAQAEGME